MTRTKDEPPDDLPAPMKELMKRRDSLTDEELDQELAKLMLLYCNTDCPKQNNHRKCINTLGHSGQHYCPNHGNFS